jgi:hypothetical protein
MSYPGIPLALPSFYLLHIQLIWYPAYIPGGMPCDIKVWDSETRNTKGPMRFYAVGAVNAQEYAQQEWSQSFKKNNRSNTLS